MQQLLDKWFEKRITPAESEELFQWLLQQEDGDILESMVAHSWENAQQSETLDDEKSARILEASLDAVKSADEPLRGKLISPWYFGWKAAAAVFILLGSAYLLYKITANPAVNFHKQPTVAARTDVPAPAKDLARIELSNGKVVYLDSIGKGKIGDQGAAEMFNSDQHVVSYRMVQESGDLTTIYNTLRNPRGSRVANIVLSDGTRVCLNAGSSLKFPVAFGAGERTVELSGEGYFEVAQDRSKPFHVVSKDNPFNINVLGTVFNVKAYADDRAAKVTLISGAVSLDNGISTKRLSPGQQASLVQERQMVIHDDADVDAATAWKNGRFYFDKLEVPEIMKEISRWYGVNVNYVGNISARHFSGIIPRSSKLSEVLRIFERAGIHYKISDNDVTIFF